MENNKQLTLGNGKACYIEIPAIEKRRRAAALSPETAEEELCNQTLNLLPSRRKRSGPDG
jgi:hypothetical protein